MMNGKDNRLKWHDIFTLRRVCKPLFEERQRPSYDHVDVTTLWVLDIFRCTDYLPSRLSFDIFSLGEEGQTKRNEYRHIKIVSACSSVVTVKKKIF